MSVFFCFLDFMKKEIQLAALQKRNYAQIGGGVRNVLSHV